MPKDDAAADQGDASYHQRYTQSSHFVSTAQRMNQPTVTNRPIKPAIAIPTKKRSTASITIPLGIAPTDLFDRLTGPLGNPHGPLVGAAKRPRQPGGEFASAGAYLAPTPPC